MFIQSCSRMRQCNPDHGRSSRDAALCTLPHPLIHSLMRKSISLPALQTHDENIQCCDLNVCPQNSHIGILMPKVMVLGNGAFEWWSYHEHTALISEINALREEAQESSHASSVMWAHWEVCSLQPRKRPSPEMDPAAPWSYTFSLPNCKN